MSRGLGVVEALRELLPETVVAAFAVLTQLGDVWLLFVAISLYYWFGNRERGAFVLGTALGAIALTVALKGLFALPRPAEALRFVEASGYGFPSGHAIASTTVWGAFALVLERGTRGRRLAAAGLLVATVSLSRVVIGVHYAVDVVVGISVGVAYLAAVFALADRKPGRVFAGAVGISALAVVTTTAGPDAVASLGGALGASAVWLGFDRVPDTGVRWPTAVAALGVLAGLGYVGTELGLALPAVLVVNALVQALVLSTPLLAERVKNAKGMRNRPSGSDG